MRNSDYVNSFLESFTFRFARAKLNVKCNIIGEDENFDFAHNALLQSRVTKFAEMCIKIYKPLNATQKIFLNGQLTFSVSNHVLQEFEHIWELIFPDCKCCVEPLDVISLAVHEFQYRCCAYYDVLRNIRIPIDSAVAAQKSIDWILHQSSYKEYGAQNYMASIAMSNRSLGADSPVTDFSIHQYRKLLLGQTILNVLKLRGYDVDESQYYKLPSNTYKFEKALFIIADYKHTPGNRKTPNHMDETKVIRLTIGNVQKGGGACTPEGISTLNKTSNTMGSFLSALDHTPSHVESSSTRLSALNFDLLIKHPNSEIIFTSNDITSDSTETLQPTLSYYTTARISSILNTFWQRVCARTYENLPSFKDVDFSLITDSSEELALIDAILEWPRIVDSVIDFSSKQIRIATALRFIDQLGHRFKDFYSKHFILVQPSAVELNKMFARIYLLKALAGIFIEAFELFDHVWLNHKVTPQEQEGSQLIK